jgi:hypothetical protein
MFSIPVTLFCVPGLLRASANWRVIFMSASAGRAIKDFDDLFPERPIFKNDPFIRTTGGLL